MLYINNKKISSIFKDNHIITMVYQGTKLIWQAIKSCFGLGYWVNNKEWSNLDAWKNK